MEVEGEGEAGNVNSRVFVGGVVDVDVEVGVLLCRVCTYRSLYSAVGDVVVVVVVVVSTARSRQARARSRRRCADSGSGARGDCVAAVVVLGVVRYMTPFFHPPEEVGGALVSLRAFEERGR